MFNLAFGLSKHSAASAAPHAAAGQPASSQEKPATEQTAPAAFPAASACPQQMAAAAGATQLPQPSGLPAQQSGPSEGRSVEVPGQPTATCSAFDEQQVAGGSFNKAGKQPSGSRAGQPQGHAAAPGPSKSSASTLSLDVTISSSAAPSATTSQQCGDMSGPALKACRKCCVTKEASAFQMDRHNVDGLQSYCRSCKAERARERRTEKDTTLPMQPDAVHGSVGRSKPVRRTASRTRLSQPQSPESSPPWGGLRVAETESYGAHGGVAASPAARLARSRPTDAAQHSAVAVLPPAAPGHKRCSRCRVEKPRTDFHCNRTTADGLQYQCRICHQEAIGSRAGSTGRQPARQPAAKRKAGSNATRKPKSRRLSDFSNGSTSLSRDDGQQDGFAMLQRAAAVASEQDLWRDNTDLPQRAAEAPAAAQQRKRVTVMHKLCSKCHTVKPASDFWKNKSTTDGLQWFCRGCQTGVCHTLKDAARLRVAASQAAAHAQGLQPVTPALRHSHGSAKQCKAADPPTTASDRLGTGSHSRSTPGSAAHSLTGLDALLVAGSTAAAQEGAEHRRAGAEANACRWQLEQDSGDVGTAAARVTLQDVLRSAPHGGSPAAPNSNLSVAALRPVHERRPGALHEGQLSAGEVAPAGPGSSSAAHDADSGISDDGSMEHEAAVVRTSTAGSNSLQDILEACRQEAAVTAERTRLSRQLLAIGPLLMPDALRLRTVPGNAAMRAVLQRETPASPWMTGPSALNRSAAQPSTPATDGGGSGWGYVQRPAAAANHHEVSAAHPGPLGGTLAHGSGGPSSHVHFGSEGYPLAGSGSGRAVLREVPDACSVRQAAKLLPLMLLLSSQASGRV